MITADKAREITAKNQDKTNVHNIMHVAEMDIKDACNAGHKCVTLQLSKKYVPHAAEVVELLIEHGFEASFVVESYRNDIIATINISW